MEKIEVDCLSIIIIHHAYMACVDSLTDNIMPKPYTVEKTNDTTIWLFTILRWPLSNDGFYVFNHNQSWIQPSSRLPLWKFKLNIALCHMKQKKIIQKKEGRPFLTAEKQLENKDSEEVQPKGFGGWFPQLVNLNKQCCGKFPLPVANKGWCKWFTSINCGNCDVHLSLTLKSVIKYFIVLNSPYICLYLYKFICFFYQF